MKHYQRVAVNTAVHEKQPENEPQKKKKRSKFASIDELLDESKGPLDEEEQERLIQEFEHLQLEQTRTYRAIFGAVGALLAVFFAWAAADQHWHPWEQRFTGELRAAVPSTTKVQCMFLLQALSLASTSLGMLRQLPKKGQRERGCMPPSVQQWVQLRVGLAGSLACCCFWLWAHLRMVHLFGWELSPRWDLLWIPLAPVTFASACVWVVSGLDKSGREVSGFRGAKYDLKQV